MTAITPPEVRALVETMIADGVSRAMAKKILTSLSAIFSECRSRGIVATNPCDGISFQVNAGRHKKEIEVPSKDDVRAVLRYVDDRAKRYPTVWRRWRAFIYLMVHTGVRISEARGLPVDAVDFEAGIVSIRQRADELGVIGPCKSASAYRKLDLPPNVVEMLREMVGNHPLFFQTRAGAPVSYANLRRNIWNPMIKGAGVKPFAPHSLRHFRASFLIEAGANPKELQQELGHDDPAFTLRVYGHLFPENNARRRERTLAMASQL